MRAMAPLGERFVLGSLLALELLWPFILVGAFLLLTSCAHELAGTGGSGPSDTGIAVQPLLTPRATGCKPHREGGTISRSKVTIAHFKASHICPSTGKKDARASCPGYKVDHIWPLVAGGCDVVENLQYQPAEEASAKDILENLLAGKPLSEQVLHAARCKLGIIECTDVTPLPPSDDQP